MAALCSRMNIKPPYLVKDLALLSDSVVKDPENPFGFSVSPLLTVEQKAVNTETPPACLGLAGFLNLCLSGGSLNLEVQLHHSETGTTLPTLAARQWIRE